MASSVFKKINVETSDLNLSVVCTSKSEKAQFILATSLPMGF